MSFAPDAFRHMPALEGRVKDPMTSRFRFMESWIGELDEVEAAAARYAGAPPLSKP